MFRLATNLCLHVLVFVGNMVIMTTHVGTPVSDSFLANPQMWMNMNGLVGNDVQTWGFIEGAKLGFWVRCRWGITVTFLFFCQTVPTTKTDTVST